MTHEAIEHEAAPEREQLERGIYRRRTLIAVFLAFVAATMGAAFWFAPAGTELWRIVLFGIAGGAFFFLAVFVNHLIAPTYDGY